MGAGATSALVRITCDANSPRRAALGYPPMTSTKGESYHCSARFCACTDASAGDTS